MSSDALDPAEFEALLIAAREELARTPDNDAAAVVELDQTRVGRLSRMDAMQGQAMAQASEQRRKLELKRIDAALKRLADGDYGFCLRCDEAIAETRLRAHPANPLCVACASKNENASPRR